MKTIADGRKSARECPVCNGSLLRPAATKFGVAYSTCTRCGVVFSDEIDPDIILTHNDSPEARADVQLQKTRLQRVTQYLGRKPQKMLDFGCGRGDYVEFLNGLGVDTAGIDQDTPLKLSDIPPQSVDAVNMVEVIEHLGDPAGILRQLTNVLKAGGIIYIESSFVDFIGDPQQSGYVDPRIGHCCIHSRQSIAYLATELAMGVSWINNNVVVMHKG